LEFSASVGFIHKETLVIFKISIDNACNFYLKFFLDHDTKHFDCQLRRKGAKCESAYRFETALFDVNFLRYYEEKRSRRTPAAYIFTVPRHA
jgi:hypothetical protein